MWIKKSKCDQANIAISHGYYFLHSCEICLVGVKNKKGNCLQYLSKVTNDVILAKMGIQSQKPNAIYDVIDAMLPGARKIELFAKNHKYVILSDITFSFSHSRDS